MQIQNAVIVYISLVLNYQTINSQIHYFEIGK
jgi:hypothetical protein